MFTDSLGVDTTLTDDWVLTVELNCELNELTLSDYIPDTEVQIFGDSLNTVTVSKTSSVSATIP